MLGAMLISLIVMMVLAFAIVWLAMWALRRWVHVYASIALGLLATAYFVQNIIRGHIHCAQPGEWIPPEPGSGGEGMQLHNCDAPFGAIDRLYLYYLGPVLVIGLCGLVLKFWRDDALRAGHQA
jgi:hypothetical protein